MRGAVSWPFLHNVNTSLLAFLALGGLCVATLLALLAPLGWPFELFAHFRPQYAVTAALLAVLLAWRRRAVVAGIALVLAFWNGLPIVQRALAESPSFACTGPVFTVATARPRSSRRLRARAYIAGPLYQARPRAAFGGDLSVLADPALLQAVVAINAAPRRGPCLALRAAGSRCRHHP